MSEEKKESTALTPRRPAAVAGRSRVGWYEPEIYIEDVLAHVPNKYLAVNIAAKRARQLNQQELPVGELAKQAQKPTTQALLELVEGRLQFTRIQTRPAALLAGQYDEETDQTVAELLDEEAQIVEEEEEESFEGFDEFEDEDLDID